jgi:very-short-patch-repair endonuclease
MHHEQLIQHARPVATMDVLLPPPKGRVGEGALMQLTQRARPVATIEVLLPPPKGEGRGGALMHHEQLTQRARALRRNMTHAERTFWGRVRRGQIHGRRFRRQHPIGDYIVDFVCPKAKLVIEIDGGRHALNAERDAARTRQLLAAGYRVLRFWNNDVLSQIDAVIEVVATACVPSPSAD